MDGSSAGSDEDDDWDNVSEFGVEGDGAAGSIVASGGPGSCEFLFSSSSVSVWTAVLVRGGCKKASIAHTSASSCSVSPNSLTQ